MCGIIGILGAEPAAPLILEGLKRLEYRGYDSAGIATLVDGEIERRRAEGKLGNLDALLHANPLPGIVGIGHTRWATHGAPTEANAHPHATEKVAVVHNGIIENFRTLRERLSEAGAVFQTETDTEVIAHLITHYLDQGARPRDAASRALAELEGAFALAIIFRGEDDLMIGARRGSPLAIGFADDAVILGSDAFALGPFARRISYLEEGDWAVLTRGMVTIYDHENREAERPVKPIEPASAMVDKGNYRHFMAKEIHEQPEVIGHTIAEYVDPLREAVDLPDLGIDLASVTRLSIIGCGTAFYAGQVAKYWFEKFARIGVDVDIASEFRYRDPVLDPGGLAVFISQSGETADTLAALRHCKAQGVKTLGIINVRESSIEREADAVLPTQAGPEIGVASTKAFTCQLTVLAALALAVAKAKGRLTDDEERAHVRTLLELPRHVVEALAYEPDVMAIASDLAHVQDIVYVGRGAAFPIALEGALKLKEISYIHAEGQAAGELKHGSIALIDENVPIIVLAPRDPVFDKTVSNMHEVAARDGKVVLVSDADGFREAGDVWRQITVPAVPDLILPQILAVPVQLLAYHTAVYKGTDVDQPRNLAKSVTVE